MKNKVNFKVAGFALLMSLGIGHEAYANWGTTLGVSSTMETQQSTVKIKGHITDVSGEPIIGANVLVKGSTIGMISDIDGNFALDVPETGVLQVSYIGYITQEIKLVPGKRIIRLY